MSEPEDRIISARLAGAEEQELERSLRPRSLSEYVGQEKAKEWLAEAGYPEGEGFPTLTLMHNTSEALHKIAQAIAAMWQDTLNVDVVLENQEWKVYLQTIQMDTPVEEMPHVFRSGWCADYPDQNNWLHEVFHVEVGRNSTRATASEFEELTKAAQLETDPAQRKELYKRAEKILVEDEARMAPILYYTTVTLTKPWITHRTYAEMGGVSFFQWKIDWDAKKAAVGE